MDNVNVIRVGFFAPAIIIPDTDREIDDPIDRSGAKYTCLILVNADEFGARVIGDIEKALSISFGGHTWNVSAIVPEKVRPAGEFKARSGFSTRLFSDGDIRYGKHYHIADSASAKPKYHATIFVIGDEGSVRYRCAIEDRPYNDKEIIREMSGIA